MAVVDDDDYAEVCKYKWTSAVRPTTVYAYRMVNRKAILLHRFILGLHDVSKVDVDHKDHNGLNCRKKNLRLATRSQNIAGARKHRDGKRKYKGVWKKSKNSWVAELYVNGERKRKYGFKSEEEAARWYDLQACLWFGEFAHTNF